MGKKSFKSVYKVQKLGINLNKSNCIHEEINSRLNSEGMPLAVQFGIL
jgi:hypothetical protein